MVPLSDLVGEHLELLKFLNDILIDCEFIVKV